MYWFCDEVIGSFPAISINIFPKATPGLSLSLSLSQIRATLLSRKTVNLFDTKKDFVGVINDSET